MSEDLFKDLKNKRLLNTEEAIRYLGIASPKTFKKVLVDTGKITPILIDGKNNKYDIKDLDNLIEEEKKTNKLNLIAS